MTQNPDSRVAYTAGLRALADLLDGDPEIPLPYQGSEYAPMSITFLSCPDPKARLAYAARVMPGPLQKESRSGEYGNYFDLTGAIHGVHFKLTAYREAVCERVVTGTTDVVREVPDPEALKAVPTVTVTETVEDVTWVCRPLLSEASS